MDRWKRALRPVPGRRRWQALAGVGGAVVLALLLLKWVASARDPQAPVPEPVAQELRLSSLAVPAPTSPEPAHGASARGRPSMPETACRDAAPRPDAALPGSAAEAEQRAAQAKRVTESTLLALSRSADPLANATALLLKPMMAELERIQRRVEVRGCETEACLAAAAASAAESASAAMPSPLGVDPAFAAALDAASDAVARMAAASANARLYALAFAACSASTQQPGACQLISADQWARLDADNAVPWRHVAGLATERGDTTALAEAMHRMAQARHSRTGWGTMLGLVAQHAPAEDAAMEGTLAMMAQVIGVQSTWFLGTYQTASRFCGPEAVRDANRRQTCGDLAEVMVGRSDTLLEQRVGLSIGQRSGWSQQRIDAIKHESDSIAHAFGRLMLEPTETNCSRMRLQLAYFASAGTHGETGAMKSLLANTPSILRATVSDTDRAAGYPDRPK